MTITEVKFRRFINEGKLRAVVSLTFDGRDRKSVV